MAAIVDLSLKRDLELLVEAQQWAAIKTFFSTWNDSEEQIDKGVTFSGIFF